MDVIIFYYVIIGTLFNYLFIVESILIKKKIPEISYEINSHDKGVYKIINKFGV